MRWRKLSPVSPVALAVLACSPLVRAADLNLHAMPASTGCPVNLSVLEQAEGKLLPIMPRADRANHLIVRLQNVGEKPLRSAEITIFGYSALYQLTPAGAAQKSTRVKKVQVWWRDVDGSLGADVTLDWFGVRSVRVDSITYAESGTWTPSKEHYCVAAPGGTMLLGRLR